ncbi:MULTISPECIES: TetR/AcrR family transcriptional regulator [unclassified Mesorhizobium]|uniref:TetR/AcrR family transcriptional regulator n=1 Tax=unclassified Mesorhizobium TaxID=325217 RepID=UPI000FD1B238|nr:MULTISPECIES: TetR/AcrR family transcriptional regulator [unclassified Mesorhizobium]RUX00448.1 TetR/AcrR family transcriptional regulator [Mesorhizobium sp. M8A.F.Ca.ET.023.01.1.1]TGR41235.1 TetR/AcrR family transcriptional regulator [bacterium M00.F.Ca.ET.199.01.1.1]TGU32029.1 TetR/AcrR family transcriptional regulator [bacterium M00.F.Ca.ET.156.01.1.1]TGV86172.1 TetR/AcrR family transcriptional regulator [Mesorhizobium sp. M00.F.Ca.ET.149.01.1.1]RWC70808.1 MAG: TetR/AcrR family transcrip
MRPGVSPDTFPPRGHEAKRMSIVDAAAGVFCREGFAGANIDLIAAEAGVSRQTVYNHHRDKEKLFIAVVRDLTERCNAGIFATIATFPDQPGDLEADLIGFAVRLNQNCICNRDGKFLRKLIQTEGERYPELFAEWREQGPGRTWPAIAARFARLAYGGHLTIDDPDVAARQFLGLVNAELQTTFMLGGTPREDEVVQSATNGVRTFLRAFGKRPSPTGVKKHTALANA